MPIATDRRTLFKLGAFAAGGLAAPQIMVRAAQAQSQPSPAFAGFDSVKVGQFKVSAIRDGVRPSEDVAGTFGADQTPEAVAEVLASQFLPPQGWVNSFTPTLVETGSEVVLFDTGLGEGGRQGGMGQLRDRLAAAGRSAEDVSIVVLTHFHGDHIGGLMEGDAPAFPNARYVAGQAEYDFWTAPERLSGPTEGAAKNVAAKVVPLAEKMTFIGDGDAVVPGITGMLAAGHTPGHMIFLLESEGKKLAVTGDTANHYVVSLLRPDWHVRFDANKEMGAASRRKVFDMLATERMPFIGYHMPSVGFVDRVDGGFRFIPETYQLEL